VQAGGGVGDARDGAVEGEEVDGAVVEVRGGEGGADGLGIALEGDGVGRGVDRKEGRIGEAQGRQAEDLPRLSECERKAFERRAFAILA
jgi:hypothetical protein